MPIPDFQTLMLPVLKYLSDGQTRTSRAVKEYLAEGFKLTEAERAQLLPSGTVSRFDNNVSWAITFLSKALLLSRPQRGQYCITDRGRDALKQGPDRIDMKYLTRYEEYVDWRESSLRDDDEESRAPVAKPATSVATPEEQFGSAYRVIRAAISADILERAKSCSPRFFERLVVKLLVRMGYGGSEQEAIARVVGKSGDGGIDGIIQEDKLGLDSIYVQAKRWQGSVGQETVRDFFGSLDQHGAKRGVIITTSGFTAAARDFVTTARTDKKIVLIDGNRLADLMIDYDLGVTTIETYAIKRIDSDFFEEE